MTIPYEELQGYPRAGMSNGRFNGVRVFRVAWSQWPAFYGELFGKFEYISGTATITLPATFPGINYTYVTDVTVEGVGKITSGPLGNLSSTANEYAYADLTCTYSHLPPPETFGPSIPSGTILTYSSNLGMEIQTVPGRLMHFNMAGPPLNPKLPDETPFGIRIPTEDMNLSFMRVPTIPSALRTLRGTVNGGTFMGYAAETVLFLGASISREFQIVIPPATPALYRLDYHFSVKSILDNGSQKGWNHFYRSEGDGAGNSWVPVLDDAGGKPFPTADLSQLFTLA